MTRKIAMVALFMMIANTFLFAATTVSRGGIAAEMVEPSESIVSFLRENGVDIELVTSESKLFDAQLAAFISIQPVEDEASLYEQLVAKISAQLFGEHTRANVIYMDLGSKYRWAVSPVTLDE